MSSFNAQVKISPTSAAENVRCEFSPAEWLKYFQDNRQNRAVIPFSNSLTVPSDVREPLIQSLQRFQVGETGEGTYLKKFAMRTGDATYLQCIDLFLKEEHTHARILAEMIAALDGDLIRWHWSDALFTIFRRALGLKTEVFVLLIAEVIGKCFYLQCARNLQNEQLRNAFFLIVLDEIAHIEFHSEFLLSRFSTMWQPIRVAIYFIWSALFHAASLAFVVDHRRTLEKLDVTQRTFLADCTKTFDRTANQALNLNRSVKQPAEC